jgi:hypothetical protein
MNCVLFRLTLKVVAPAVVLIPPATTLVFVPQSKNLELDTTIDPLFAAPTRIDAAIKELSIKGKGKVNKGY